MAKTNALTGTTVVTYGECIHNYAAQVMRHTFDGCGEYEPKGEPGTSEALLCGVCGCHRNFHRKQEINLPLSYFQAAKVRIFQSPTTTTSPQPPCPPPQSQLHSAKHAKVNPQPIESPLKPFNNEMEERRMKRKRRTNFTQAQKDQMTMFAERLGWRIRGHGKEVYEFCEDIGITRQVLKVWINNNKRLMKSRDSRRSSSALHL
ncbi:hypothetical protein RHMOL_Rhmol06G0149700 [Rhododendron molle]|uniref:Uncharacterized protein n=1 Tax=Rhododendron molle TaxID=49168 RepID=A0ACC0NES0_RHOML|nr:hypothetical protein RHMOL_Rhmol06G0149700 [Rhododendron molle]